MEQLDKNQSYFFLFNQEEFDKINDMEDYDGEEPLEISEIPLDILKELASLNKAEVISFKELKELYISPEEFMDVFNMYEEFYPIAIA
jgi:predicted transcriptional regulator